MTMYARDVSNYTVPLTADLLAQWKAEGIGLVLIQAFPSTYRQQQQQRAQMAACEAAEMLFDCYVYDYLGDPSWLTGALDGIDQIQEKPRMIWLDEEDVQTEEGWSQAQRQAAITASVQAVEARGYECGIYTGPWWWTPRVGSGWFTDHKLWVSEYDGVADASVFTQFGGWSECAIKQYEGTQSDGTDLNVLSAAEESDITGGDVTDPERQQMQETIDGLVSTIGLLTGDDMKPLLRKTAGQYVKDYVNVARARADAVGIAHV